MRLPELNIVSKIQTALSDVNTQKMCKIASAISAITAVGLVIGTCLINPSFLVAVPVLLTAGVVGLVSTIAKAFERTVDPRVAGLNGLMTSIHAQNLRAGTINVQFGNVQTGFEFHADFNTGDFQFGMGLGYHRNA